MTNSAHVERVAGGHRLWVRLCHWPIAVGVLVLCVSGFVILMAHPRLYWGETGNDMTPTWLELPISRNYHHGGWETPQTFQEVPSRPVSAVRTFDLFNQNGWARSLHFLAAWWLLGFGAVYGGAALALGHLRRNLLPGREGLSLRLIFGDVAAHLRRSAPVAPGPPYNLLQRWAYFIVLFLCLPLSLLTGLTMAPAVTAACPWLLDVFHGTQSARSLHFLSFCALALFVLVHVAMVVRTGFKAQLIAMIVGRSGRDA